MTTSFCRLTSLVPSRPSFFTVSEKSWGGWVRGYRMITTPIILLVNGRGGTGPGVYIVTFSLHRIWPITHCFTTGPTQRERGRNDFGLL